jgi:hypothetical protein
MGIVLGLTASKTRAEDPGSIVPDEGFGLEDWASGPYICTCS